jgi:hypothetical protein
MAAQFKKVQYLRCSKVQRRRSSKGSKVQSLTAFKGSIQLCKSKMQYDLIVLHFQKGLNLRVLKGSKVSAAADFAFKGLMSLLVPEPAEGCSLFPLITDH